MMKYSILSLKTKQAGMILVIILILLPLFALLMTLELSTSAQQLMLSHRNLELFRLNMQMKRLSQQLIPIMQAYCVMTDQSKVLPCSGNFKTLRYDYGFKWLDDISCAVLSDRRFVKADVYQLVMQGRGKGTTVETKTTFVITKPIETACHFPIEVMNGIQNYEQHILY